MFSNNYNRLERMIHDVLGESSLSRSIRNVVTESSLSRVMKWRTEHDTGAIATARFDKSKEQAKREKYELQEWLKSNGYAYTKFDGYYQEQEMPQASREDSLLVVDINDKGNLKEVIQQLGAKYKQETVLFRPKGKDSKSMLIKTTPKGMGKETPHSTGTDWGKRGGAAWSEIGGRAFGDKIDIPGSFWNDEEEEAGLIEVPTQKVTIKGVEILYTKKGSARGIRVVVKSQDGEELGSTYVKYAGIKDGVRTWTVESVKTMADESTWEMVEKELSKMAKKNPSTIIRLLRNRAYELPGFKPTTMTESVSINQITNKIKEIL